MDEKELGELTSKTSARLPTIEEPVVIVRILTHLGLPARARPFEWS